jgi:hypothetical protein
VDGQLGSSPRQIEVVSVHRRVLNLRLDPGGLVSVGAREVSLAAGGVAIDLDAGVALADLGLAVGQQGTIDRHRLSIPAARLEIRLEGADRWEPRPASPRVSAAALGRRAREARAVAIAEGRVPSLLPLLWWTDGAPEPGLMARAAGATSDLRRAAVTGEGARIEAAARRLAGLGPGLTPAGDDCLGGFAAAWALEAPALGLRLPGALAVLDALWRGASAGASHLGRAWLRHACRGEVAEPMGRFFTALFGDEDSRLAEAVRGVLAMGATSGTDWMTGAVLGTDAVLERREREWS